MIYIYGAIILFILHCQYAVHVFTEFHGPGNTQGAGGFILFIKIDTS